MRCGGGDDRIWGAVVAEMRRAVQQVQDLFKLEARFLVVNTLKYPT